MKRSSKRWSPTSRTRLSSRARTKRTSTTRAPWTTRWTAAWQGSLRRASSLLGILSRRRATTSSSSTTSASRGSGCGWLPPRTRPTTASRPRAGVSNKYFSLVGGVLFTHSWTISSSVPNVNGKYVRVVREFGWKIVVGVWWSLVFLGHWLL